MQAPLACYTQLSSAGRRLSWWFHVHAQACNSRFYIWLTSRISGKGDWAGLNWSGGARGTIRQARSWCSYKPAAYRSRPSFRCFRCSASTFNGSMKRAVPCESCTVAPCCLLCWALAFKEYIPAVTELLISAPAQPLM